MPQAQFADDGSLLPGWCHWRVQDGATGVTALSSGSAAAEIPRSNVKADDALAASLVQADAAPAASLTTADADLPAPSSPHQADAAPAASLTPADADLPAPSSPQKPSEEKGVPVSSPQDASGDTGVGSLLQASSSPQETSEENGAPVSSTQNAALSSADVLVPTDLAVSQEAGSAAADLAVIPHIPAASKDPSDENIQGWQLHDDDDCEHVFVCAIESVIYHMSGTHGPDADDLAITTSGRILTKRHVKDGPG